MLSNNSRTSSSRRSKRVTKSALRTSSFIASYVGGNSSVEGWLERRTAFGTNGWRKSYFVLHEQYLSFLKKRPYSDDEFKEHFIGSINMWSISGVTVEGTEITIHLSGNLQNTKRTTKTALSKLMSAIRKDEIVLRAESADMAQRWVQAMYAGAFEGKAQQAFDGEGSMLTELIPDKRDPAILDLEESGLKDAGLSVNRLRIQFSKRPSRPLFESRRLYGTRLALGQVPPTARVQVDLYRNGKAIGMLTSKPLYKYFKGVDGVLDVLIMDTDVARDAVWVRIRWDVLHALRYYVNEVGLGLAVLFVFATFATCIRLMGLPRGIYASVVVSAMAAVAIMYFNGDNAILEMVRIIPIREAQELLAEGAELEKERNIFHHFGIVTQQRKAKKLRNSKRRSFKGPQDGFDGDDDDDDDDDDDELLVEELKMGYGSNLTAQEKELVNVLRDKVQDLIKSSAKDPFALGVYERFIDHDWRIVRFLRARNLKIKKAEKMLRRSLKWRIDYKADLLHERYRPPQWLIEYLGCDMINGLLDLHDDRSEWYFRDKEGHLALFLRTGRLNQRKFFKKLGSGEALFEAGIFLFEMILHDLEKHFFESGGKIAPQITLVLDLDGFSLSNQIPVNQALALARKYLGTLLEAYPEIISTVVVINAPWLFNSLFNLFMPFFPERLLAKIWIGGHSEKAYQRRIMKIFDPDQVPVALGGNYQLGTDPYSPGRIPCQGPFLPDEGASLLRIDKKKK